MLISEIARLAGLSKDGVRHYEALGLIASTPRRAGSRTYRDYAPDVLATIEKVRQAQRLGLSLSEIGPLLLAYDASRMTKADTLAFLQARLAVVRERIAELAQIESFLLEKIARYSP